jgi:hypothetical protein
MIFDLIEWRRREMIQNYIPKVCSLWHVTARKKYQFSLISIYNVFNNFPIKDVQPLAQNCFLWTKLESKYKELSVLGRLQPRWVLFSKRHLLMSERNMFVLGKLLFCLFILWILASLTQFLIEGSFSISRGQYF